LIRRGAGGHGRSMLAHGLAGYCGLRAGRRAVRDPRQLQWFEVWSRPAAA
jgi:hypothetical protein